MHLLYTAVVYNIGRCLSRPIPRGRRGATPSPSQRKCSASDNVHSVAFDHDAFEKFITAPEPRGLGTTKDAIRKYLGDATSELRRRFEMVAEGNSGAPAGNQFARKTSPDSVRPCFETAEILVDMSPPIRNRSREPQTGNSIGYAVRRFEREAATDQAVAKTPQHGPGPEARQSGRIHDRQAGIGLIRLVVNMEVGVANPPGRGSMHLTTSSLTRMRPAPMTTTANAIARLYTVGEAARFFGVAHWQVRRLFESGKLPPAPRVGMNRVIADHDLPEVGRALADAGYLAPPGATTL